MAEQLRDFAQFNGHQELSLALSKVNDILSDIKLRKPKQQTYSSYSSSLSLNIGSLLSAETVITSSSASSSSQTSN